MTDRPIRIGTRGSALARWQAHDVANQLRAAGAVVEIVYIKTSGDVQQSGSIANIGAQGVFTKEIQRSLLQGEIDLAVHSLKDLPTEIIDGLTLAAVPKRGSAGDAFLSVKAKTLAELPEGATIGTGSMRRQAQVRRLFGDKFQLTNIRGNVETRINKMKQGEVDALILAVAGLERLGLSAEIRALLPSQQFLPAIGQGALGIEIRTGDTETESVVSKISEQGSFIAVLAERAFLRTLQGGCIAPIGAYAHTYSNVQLKLHGRVLSPDGQTCLEDRFATLNPNGLTPKDAETLGRHGAETLQKRGADEIVNALRLTG